MCFFQAVEVEEFYCGLCFPGGRGGGDGYRLGRHATDSYGGSERAQPAMEEEDGSNQKSHDHRRHRHRHHRLRTRNLLRRASAHLMIPPPSGDDSRQ